MIVSQGLGGGGNVDDFDMYFGIKPKGLVGGLAVRDERGKM